MVRSHAPTVYERATLQPLSMHVQRDGLRTVSLSVVPIVQVIGVLPLIEAIATTRASRMRALLLLGGEQPRSSIAITSVEAVAGAVPHVLLHAAQAPTVVGAIPLLTGIRTHVAQPFVSLGTGRSMICPTNSLPHAGALALRLQGGARTRA